MKLEDTFLYQEIHQQPEAIANLLNTEASAIEKIGAAIRAYGSKNILIAARGTSDNAGRYAQYLLGASNQFLVSLATPSLFSIYQKPPVLKNVIVIGISQSGKSPDIVSVVQEARNQGALTIAITNQPGSDLERAAEYSINLHAGLERSVAATKTYTTELTAIAMLSAAIAQNQAAMVELNQLPGLIQNLINDASSLAISTQRYRYMQHCLVIGRGFHYASAYECSLKLKELTYTKAEPYSSADFLHGPFALLEPGYPVIVFSATGAILTEMRDFTLKVQQRGAELIIISNDDQMLGMAELAIGLPKDLPEWITPILAIIPMQLFAMYLAHARKIDIDAPRGIKKVTETY